MKPACLLSAFVAIALLSIDSQAIAQLAPEIGYMHPAGVQAGTTTEVTIGGYDWTPDMQLFSHDPAVKIELIGPPSPVLISEPPYWFGAKARGYAWPLPREFRARVTVAADISPRFVRWQAANANGISPTSLIQIGTAQEIIEAADHALPQLLPPLPVTVSGQIRRIEEVDRYVIRPAQTGLITIELVARQLTSSANPMALHGMIKVVDERDHGVVDVSASEGNDLASTFFAEANVAYTISLHDLDFGGDRSYVYRLLITPGPRVVAAYPAAGKRGETRTVELVGWGLATGQPKLESVQREIQFPADSAMDVFSYSLETPFGISKPYQFLLSDLPELVEGAVFTEYPAAVTGALDVRSSPDVYSLNFNQGDMWRIAAKSRKTELPLDLDLCLKGPDGKEIATNDDVPGSTDPELMVTVPQSGCYQLSLTDRSDHGVDRASCYRLSIEKPRDDFVLTAPDFFSVPVGSTAKLTIAVQRFGAFKGPIGISIVDLPAGMTVPAGLVIGEDKTSFELEVTCAADAAVSARLAYLTASATVGQSTVTRPIKPLVVASIMKPRIKITPEGLDDVSKVRRGSTHLFPLFIDRMEGFTGDITLEMTAKQQRHRQGLSGEELVVSAEVKKFDYPIFVPEWMETTKTSRMILNGAVRVPDPQGNVRTLLQRMELRLGILPEGALMKLSLAHSEIPAALGEEIVIPLTISRVAEFRETVTVEVVPSASAEGLIVSDAIAVPVGQAKAQLTIKLAERTKLRGELPVVIRATAKQDGQWLVKSEATLVIDIQP